MNQQRLEALVDEVHATKTPEACQRVGERICLLRRRQRWTLRELAAQAQIRVRTLRHVERGYDSLAGEHLVALAKVLGTSPGYLLGLEPVERRQRRKADDTGTLEPTLPGMVTQTV